MYGIVSKDGELLWTQKFKTIGAAKLAVRHNHFTYEVGVAKVEGKRAVGEIYQFNGKWEVINND